MRSIASLVAGLLWLLLAHSASAAEYEVKILGRTPVEYPPAARRAGHEGTVTVLVEVLPNGSVGDAKVVTSSGSPLLDEAGLKSVRGWRFQPKVDKRGRSVVMRGIVKVEFKLTDPEVKPDTEAHRLADIWLAYRSYKRLSEEFVTKCEAIGVDAKAARAANQTLHAEADAKFSKLEQSLRAEIAANGVDPERRLNEIGQGLEAEIKEHAAKLYARAGDLDGQRRNCEGFLGVWSTAQGGFQASEYYEPLMAL
jgi:TonB family protein